MITNFYDRLFLYYYNLKKNSDDTPQYFPVIIITVAQTTNIFLFVIVLFHLLKIDFSTLPKVFLVLGGLVLIFNVYLYQIKERKEVVLRKDIKLSLLFKISSYFYVLASIFSPLFLIYFFKEVL